MASTLIQPVASSLINAITAKGVTRAGKRREGGILSLLTLPLMIKALGKGVMRAGQWVRRAEKGYDDINHMNENF